VLFASPCNARGRNKPAEKEVKGAEKDRDVKKRALAKKSGIRKGKILPDVGGALRREPAILKESFLKGGASTRQPEEN